MSKFELWDRVVVLGIVLLILGEVSPFIVPHGQPRVPGGDFRVFAPTRPLSDYTIAEVDLFIALRDDRYATIHTFYTLEISNMSGTFEFALKQSMRTIQEDCFVFNESDSSVFSTSATLVDETFARCRFKFNSLGIHKVAIVMVVTRPVATGSYGTRSLSVTFLRERFSPETALNPLSRLSGSPKMTAQFSLTVTFPASWSLSRDAPADRELVVGNYTIASWSRRLTGALEPQGMTVSIQWTVEDEAAVIMNVNFFSEKAIRWGTLLTPFAFSMRRRNRNSIKRNRRKHS